MKRDRSIYFKAAFLLCIFSLNTLVGFACAIGVNVGIGKGHHHDEMAQEVHEHSDRKKHNHQYTVQKNSDNENEEGCCNDNVIKNSQEDKSVPQTSKLINPIFFTALASTFYSLKISFHSTVNSANKYFVRGHHPPIPDIRIVIQSFQI